MFLNHLYDSLDEPEAKIVDVFICKLRKKPLANASGGKDYIETVWGRGFAMREAAGRSRRLAASPRKFCRKRLSTRTNYCVPKAALRKRPD